MKEAFTISRAQLHSSDRYALRREVLRHTGSEDEVASILRSLDRLGSDRSIVHYEMTPIQPRRVAPGAPAVLWNVRVVREARAG
jgi:hypothetical protein